MISPRWLAAAALLLGAAACGSEQDDRPVSWNYIVKAILRPNCATSSCHSERAAINDVALEDPHDAYVRLTDEDFIKLDNLPESKLPRLLRGDNVYRMPPDQPLPDADIELIERWLLDGAPEN